MQYRRLKRFSICWVPDLEKKDSLAGELSHPEKLPPMPIRYIGILSRFGKKEMLIAASSVEDGGNHAGAADDAKQAEGGGAEDGDAGEDCDLLILLSGPEPQRTIFEKIVLGQLAGYPGKTILVRGLPRAHLPDEPDAGHKAPDPRDGAIVPGMNVREHLPVLTIHDHLPAEALNAVICGARLVLSRPGYSSVMDLAGNWIKNAFCPHTRADRAGVPG